MLMKLTEEEKKARKREYARAYRQANPEKVRESCRASRDKQPDKSRARNLMRSYGITIAQYDAMFAAQGGRCAICLSDKPRGSRGRHFAVDHCHSTGKVRGLLCSHCNTVLGKMNDNPDTLLRAVDYLKAA
jgi:hypothetical protein